MVMKMKMNNIKTFIINNYKFLFIGVVSIFLLYWIIFIFTPKVEMSVESNIELKQIDEKIDGLVFEQTILQNEIDMFQEELVNIDNNLGVIKNSQDLNAKNHGKKISNAQSLSHDELVRFFTERYNDSRIY